MTDRIYYIVPPEHELMPHINKYEQSVTVFNSACRDFAQKHCGERNFWQNGTSFTGLTFKGDVPEGWGHNSSDPAGMYKPYGRSKRAYELRAEIKKLPRIMTAWEFEAPFGDSPVFTSRHGRSVILFISMEHISNDVVIGVPARAEMPKILDGCKELKTSEYYAMKETEKAAK